MPEHDVNVFSSGYDFRHLTFHQQYIQDLAPVLGHLATFIKKLIGDFSYSFFNCMVLKVDSFFDSITSQPTTFRFEQQSPKS